MEVQQSLQEIASLLFLLHDFYLNNVDSSDNILMSLWRFIQDIKLDHKISILDVEYLRQKAINNSQQGNDHMYMGYEEFYHWLSGVGQYLLTPFQGNEANSERARKQSLHHILTVYVIPCMSQWEKLTNSSSSGLPSVLGSPSEKTALLLERRKSIINQSERLLVTKVALEIMTSFREFLLLWFKNLVHQVLFLFFNHFHLFFFSDYLPVCLSVFSFSLEIVN